MSCRVVIAVLFAFCIIFVIVDIVDNTKNYYNFVSLSGLVVYLLLMYIFSTTPDKASMIAQFI